jgi:hypothetical protein
MRKLSLGQPPFSLINADPERRWIAQAFVEIQRASHEQITEEIADTFTLSNVTETRTLDPTTATAEDVANVLATILQDMKARGVKRG